MFKQIVTISYLLITVAVSSQVSDSVEVRNLMNLGLEDLVKIKVDVSSVKPLDILSTPSSVTIVNREMIEDNNFQSVAEALSMVPGIDVLQTVIDRNVTTSRGILQNFYANKVLFMINSVPSWQPLYGDFHLERIDINDVERIEILKGPASVLYGTNAYAGVVNIILNEKKLNTLDAYTRIGYPTQIGAGVSTRIQKNDFNLYISANSLIDKKEPYTMQADSRFPFNGDSTYVYQEQYQTGNFIVRGSYKSHSILLNGFSFDHTYYGAEPSYTLGGGTMVENKGILFNYQMDHKFSNSNHIFLNATADYFSRNFPLSADRTNIVKLSAARYAAEAKFHSIINNFLAIDVGAHGEIRDSYGHETRYSVTDTLIRSNLLNDDNIYEGSVFIQPELMFGPFSVVIGSRYTLNSLFGNNVSFRGTVLYKINKTNSLKFIAGQSFRAPTMFELYFEHYTVKGNRDLKPEQSLSYELAYLRQVKNLFINMSGYMASYSNLIKRVSIDTLVPKYMNADEFEGIGFEVELKYSKDGLGKAFVNYNYIDGYNNPSDENYRFVPNHSISFGINKSLKKIYFFTKGQYVSSVSGVYKNIDQQFYFDLGAGFNGEINDLKINHTFTIKNLTGSEFLIPQYIRDQGNVNEIPTMGFGRTIIYTLKIRY